MRAAELTRTTAETDIRLRLDLDGTGLSQIATGCGFLDHMLTLFARHGRFDLSIQCKGDTYVDDHHTVEDVGICLGDAFTQALEEKRGVVRYGSMLLPMDEALILTPRAGECCTTICTSPRPRWAFSIRSWWRSSSPLWPAGGT